MEAAEEALDAILEVPAAWEAFLQVEERAEEAFRGSQGVLHAASSSLEEAEQEQLRRWG